MDPWLVYADNDAELGADADAVPALEAALEATVKEVTKVRYSLALLLHGRLIRFSPVGFNFVLILQIILKLCFRVSSI